MRWPWRGALGAAAVVLWAVTGLGGAATVWAVTPSGWTTYRHDPARSGIDPDSTSPVPPADLWETAPGTLDAPIYAQPLVLGNRVYVATENDSVYALDAATGAVVWHSALGLAVPSGQLPCGSINPVVGITGTPVIDPATNTLYAVATIWDGSSQSSIQHQLFALDLATGAVRTGFPVAADPPALGAAGGDARHQLQRAALALTGGRVVIGYGGNAGDCGTFYGWLVSIDESGQGAPGSFQADSGPGHHGGSIWGAGSGPSVDSAGDLYAATGNGYSGSTYDFGESVLRFGPGPGLAVQDHWAPADWQNLDSTDTDIGSGEPALLGSTGLLFQSGKDGNGYLLRAGALGGIGQAAATLGFCSGESLGGGVLDPSTSTIYAACNGGLKALVLDAATPALSLKPGFSAPADSIGPPVIAGGLVWVTAWQAGMLEGLDPATGALRYHRPIPGVVHFATPSAGGGRLFVGDGARVAALSIATFPPPAGSGAGAPSAPGPGAPGPGPGGPGPGPGGPGTGPGGPGTGGPGTGGAGQGGVPGGSTASGADAPRLSRVALTARRVRVGKPIGIVLTASAPAMLTLRVERTIAGTLANGRCRAGRPRRGRSHACHLVRTEAIRRVRVAAGRHRLSLHVAALPAGAHTVIVSAAPPSSAASRSASSARPVRLRLVVTPVVARAMSVPAPIAPRA